MTPEEAVRLLEQDKQARTQAAADEVAATLKKHNCDLLAVPQILDGRIVAVIQVIAR